MLVKKKCDKTCKLLMGINMFPDNIITLCFPIFSPTDTTSKSIIIDKMVKKKTSSSTFHSFQKKKCGARGKK